MLAQHFVWLVLAYADDSESAAVVSYALMDLRRVVSMVVTTTKVVQDNPVAGMVERVLGTIDTNTGREGMLLTRGRRATEEAMGIIQAYADALPAHEATDAIQGLTERLFGP